MATAVAQTTTSNALLAWFADFVTSWACYTSSLVVSHPLDTLKIRWQTRNVRPFDTLRNDGFRSLYAGFLTPMATNGPIVALVFACNEMYRGLLMRFDPLNLLCPVSDADTAHPSQTRAEDAAKQLPLTYLAMSGGLAGLSSTLVQCPATVIRIQQQVHALSHRHDKHKHTNEKCATPPAHRVASLLYRSEGIRGLYRGLCLEGCANGIGRLTYFFTYEVTKSALTRLLSDDDDGASGGGGAGAKRGDALGVRLLAAINTAFIGWFAIYPIDVIKNKIQADAIQSLALSSGCSGAGGAGSKTFKGFWHCTALTYKQFGFRGFWVGYSVTVLRSSLINCISLPLFDALKPRMRHQFGCSGAAQA